MINIHKGSITFIYNFTTWVTGESAEENIQKFQNTIILKIKRWEIKSSITFQVDKTVLIHFTYSQAYFLLSLLTIKAKVVPLSPKVKILGVVINSQLKFYLHIAHAAKRRLYIVIALKQLKDL